MRIRQKFFVPLQPYGKEYRRDTIIPSASAWERLENQGSPFGRFQREHICRGGILQGRHRDGRQAPPHIRFSPRACLETPGHVAIQDVHQGTHTPLQASGREVCQRTGSLGRCRRAHDRSARKKTIDALLQTKSQARTARLLRLTPDQVRHVMERSVEYGLSVRSRIMIYRHLCIDEKARSKREYVTILSDGDTGFVIDVAEGRAEENAKRLIEKNLSPIQRAGVRTISMDMWQAFINVAKKLFPNAKICHDPYHLVQHLNKAVDKVRIREVKTQNELKNTKYLFLKDRASFTDKQQIKFEAISKANYEVSRAWRIKENFRDIIRTANREEAFTLYTMWFIESTRAHIPEIGKVLDMFASHSTGILNALRTGKNNGKAERLNGSIQELKTIGRGYKDAEHFRTAILFFHGGLVLHRSCFLLNSLS